MYVSFISISVAMNLFKKLIVSARLTLLTLLTLLRYRNPMGMVKLRPLTESKPLHRLR